VAITDSPVGGADFQLELPLASEESRRGTPAL
jgi:hypothetical protein